MKKLAPIVMFVYNRPEHTLRSLEALSKNDLAAESTLYIYADGPKRTDPASLAAIEETRQILRRQSWCGEVIIDESPVNRGLADSIVRGVTAVVDKHDKVIVLEDDLVTSKGFLTYMNQTLDLYEDKPEVMHISAYMYPVTKHLENGTIFLKVLSCWGWATWKRAWVNYSNDVDGQLHRLNSKRAIDKFNIRGNATFYDQLRENQAGTMKTWAVRWFASWYFKGGYAVFPKTTLVVNYGHDGSGVHCNVNPLYKPNFIADHIDVKVIPLKEDRRFPRLIDAFYRKERGRKGPVRVFLYHVKKRLKRALRIG